jgi:hypothetical protein
MDVEWGEQWWQCHPDTYAEGRAWSAEGLSWDQALERIMEGARAGATAAQIYGWHVGYVAAAGQRVTVEP